MSPLSGDGAAIRGARFNPKNVPALYLSTSIDGAIAEASQGFGHKIHPLTICSYDVDCDAIADLTDDDMRKHLGISLETMSSAWASSLSEGKRPVSWTVHDKLCKSWAGILVPSFAHRAKHSISNLVLWKWSAKLPHKVAIIDPTGRLPRNQKSWED
jgi:RES domain-containing protein